MQEDADLYNLGIPSVLAMVLLLVAARLLRETSDGSLQIPHILLDMSAVVLADEQDISNCVVDVNIRLYTGGTKTFGLKYVLLSYMHIRNQFKYHRVQQTMPTLLVYCSW